MYPKPLALDLYISPWITSIQLPQKLLSVDLFNSHIYLSCSPHLHFHFFCVSASPTSSCRWEELSFSILRKRWDLVGLLELMAKRSTGLPSRWMVRSQVSLMPLSKDMFFPFSGRRSFSAAKSKTCLSSCTKQLHVHTVTVCIRPLWIHYHNAFFSYFAFM